MRLSISPSQKVRKLLFESPSSINELAAITGWSKERTHSVLTRLRSRRQIKSAGSVESDVSFGPKNLKMYQLTQYGIYLLQLTNYSLTLQRKLGIKSIQSVALLN